MKRNLLKLLVSAFLISSIIGCAAPSAGGSNAGGSGSGNGGNTSVPPVFNPDAYANEPVITQTEHVKAEAVDGGIKFTISKLDGKNFGWCAIAQLAAFGEKKDYWGVAGTIADSAKTGEQIEVVFPFVDAGKKSKFEVVIQNNQGSEKKETIVITPTSGEGAVDYSTFDFSKFEGKFSIEKGVFKLSCTGFVPPVKKDGTQYTLGQFQLDVNSVNDGYLGSANFSKNDAGNALLAGEDWFYSVHKWEQHIAEKSLTDEEIFAAYRFSFAKDEYAGFEEFRFISKQSDTIKYSDYKYVKDSLSSVNLSAALKDEIEKSDLYTLTQSFPTSVNNCSISWESDNTNVFNIYGNRGSVNRGSEDKTVNLTAVVKKENVSLVKKFDVKVLSHQHSNAIQQAKNSLNLSSLIITSDITLPTTYYSDSKIAIEWSSSDLSIISNTGSVTRPSDESKDVTLTATIKRNDEDGTVCKKTETKVFNVRVIKQGVDMDDALAVATAKEILTLGFNGSDNEDSVTQSIDIQTSMGSGVTVSWTSSNDKRLKFVSSNQNVDDVTCYANKANYITSELKDENVTLTATLSKGSVTDTKTFVVTLPKWQGNQYRWIDGDILTDVYSWDGLSFYNTYVQYKINSIDYENHTISLTPIKVKAPAYGAKDYVSYSTFESAFNTQMNKTKQTFNELIDVSKKTTTTVDDFVKFGFMATLCTTEGWNDSLNRESGFKQFGPLIFGTGYDTEDKVRSLSSEQLYEGMMNYLQMGFKQCGVNSVEKLMEYSIYNVTYFGGHPSTTENYSYSFGRTCGLSLELAYNTEKSMTEQYGDFSNNGGNYIRIRLNNNKYNNFYYGGKVGSFEMLSDNSFKSVNSDGTTYWTISEKNFSADSSWIKIYNEADSSNVYQLSWNGLF